MIRLPAAARRALARRSAVQRGVTVGGDRPVIGADAPVTGTAPGTPAIQARDLVELLPRSRETGRVQPERFWSDLGEIAAEVVDPETGATVTRRFFGAGALLEVGAVSRVATLTVQSIRIGLNHLDRDALDAIQGAEARGCRVTVWRALFDPGSREMVSPGYLRFTGYVAGVQIETPEPGGVGRAVATCTSALDEITRYSTQFRATGSQAERRRGDTFFSSAGRAGVLRLNWGGSEAPLRDRAGTTAAPRTPTVTGADR